MLSCEFLFFQEIQTLLGLHSAAQYNRDPTGNSSGSSLFLDASVFSDLTLPIFVPGLQEKRFQHAVFKTFQGIIVLFPSMYQILLLHGIAPFIQQLVSLNTELFCNPEEVAPQILPGLCLDYFFFF